MTEQEACGQAFENGRKVGDAEGCARGMDAVVLPCRIGDTVWAIRCYRGVLVPQQGRVSEMLFTDDMKLSIVVKHICRGEWGKKVFATKEDADSAIGERRDGE